LNMARFTHFSKHALMRIDQRTRLNYFDIAEILDHDLAIDTGTELVFDRKHWLFYSEMDDSCFVAVQDSLTGLVITVLPIDYHEVLAWKIKEELYRQAAKKVKEYEPNNIKSPTEQASVIKIQARYISDQGYPKTVSLTKYEASEYSFDISRVLGDKSLDSEIKQQCISKGISTSDVLSISISLGKEKITVDWQSD